MIDTPFAETYLEFLGMLPETFEPIERTTMINPNKRKIYVAGAYSGPDVLTVLDNMRIGIQTSADLFRRGFSPFCPWLDHHFCLLIPKEKLTVEMFYQYSMDFLYCCDAVLVTQNPRNELSKGTQKEIANAIAFQIPVFYNLADLLKWSENGLRV